MLDDRCFFTEKIHLINETYQQSSLMQDFSSRVSLIYSTDPRPSLCMSNQQINNFSLFCCWVSLFTPVNCGSLHCGTVVDMHGCRLACSIRDFFGGVMYWRHAHTQIKWQTVDGHRTWSSVFVYEMNYRVDCMWSADVDLVVVIMWLIWQRCYCCESFAFAAVPLNVNNFDLTRVYTSAFLLSCFQ